MLVAATGRRTPGSASTTALLAALAAMTVAAPSFACQPWGFQNCFEPDPGIKWHESLSAGGDIPLVGDFNGDRYGAVSPTGDGQIVHSRGNGRGGDR